MRRTLTIGLLLAALIPVGVRAQDTAERAAVQRVITGFAANLQQGKLADVEAMIAPRGTHILTEGAALHSFAEYRDQYLAAEMARFSDLKYTHTGVEVVVRGTVAWASFRWQMSSGSGSPEPVLGRATAILEKVEDSWIIEHLHFSK